MDFNSNPEALSNWLSALSLLERAQKLNRISYALTVCAREFYTPEGAAERPDAAKKLLALSELQHKISAQVGSYLAGEETKVYPVEAFSRTLYAIATHQNILPALNQAISFAVGRENGAD